MINQSLKILAKEFNLVLIVFSKGKLDFESWAYLYLWLTIAMIASLKLNSKSAEKDTHSNQSPSHLTQCGLSELGNRVTAYK